MPSHDRTDQEIFETLQAADAVAQRFRALIASSGQDFAYTQFYTRIRVKSYNSIIQKIQRKRRQEGDELFSFHDITDIVGFRIVTLYDDDINNAINDLLKLIDAGGRFGESLFKPYKPLNPERLTTWDFIKEVESYPRLRQRDDVHWKAHHRVRAEITKQVGSDQKTLNHHLSKLKLKLAKDDDQQEYSSTHFLLNATSTVGKKEINVPIEVQIRTAVEDIWGEIDHQIFYKAEDLYVWTPRLEEIYAEMRMDSQAVKEASLYKLGPAITRFWRHSRDAADQIQLFKRPRTSYHRSLIVTLFYAASREYLDNADRLLRRYDNRLKLLVKTTEVDDAVIHLDECVSLMRQIRDKFDESHKTVLATLSKLTGDERDRLPEQSRWVNFSTLLTQRKLLCDLEIARLEALAVVRFKRRITSPSMELSFSEERAELRRVFDAICEFRNSWEFRIRPTAMISFWKYIIGSKIDRNLGMYHLQVAAEEMERDSSLPEWSIYLIIIQRYLSAELYEEAKRLVNANGRRSSRKIWWHSQVAIDVRVILTQALELALQSYKKHQLRDEKSGDLVFGFERDEDIRDADAIVNAASLYFELFDSPDYQRLGTTSEFMRDRVREVHTIFTNMESPPGWIRRKIGRLEQLLARLSADVERGR
jgi:ppGpp synthetase/RelA/SpoT-type nucleotidyltranferase